MYQSIFLRPSRRYSQNSGAEIRDRGGLASVRREICEIKHIETDHFIIVCDGYSVIPSRAENERTQTRT